MTEDNDDYQFTPMRHLAPEPLAGQSRLRALIAEHVFGFNYWWNEYEGMHGMRVPPGQRGNPYQIDQWYPLPDYPASWDAAGQVVERLRAMNYEVAIWLRSSWIAECSILGLGLNVGRNGFARTERSVPEAVCLAALNALGVEVPTE